MVVFAFAFGRQTANSEEANVYQVFPPPKVTAKEAFPLSSWSNHKSGTLLVKTTAGTCGATKTKLLRYYPHEEHHYHFNGKQQHLKGLAK